MWDIVCYSVIIICTFFMWLTALSGTRYYEINMQLRDIGLIKLLIHLSALLTISAIAYIISTGSTNV